MFIPPQEIRGGNVKPYVVAYLDLLGLQNRLLELDKIPSLHRTNDDWESILKRSVGDIVRTRKLVSSFYTGFKSPPDLSAREDMSEEKFAFIRSVLDDLHETETIVQWFGDCVLISFPLWRDEGYPNAVGLQRLFFATAHTYLMVATRGQCVRGGIDIGYGCEPSQGEVFSSAAVKAYRLESREARVPRVLIGDDLLSAINGFQSREWSDSPAEQVSRGILADCQRFLSVDSDGRAFFDPFQEVVLLATRRDTRIMLVYKMVVAIERELQKARSSNAPNADSIREKYEWLQQYVFRSLPPNWDKPD